MVFSTEDGSQRKPERQRVPMLAIGRSWEKGKRCLNRGWKHLVGCRRGDYARRATLGPLISGNESHGPRGRPLEYVYLLQNGPSIDPVLQTDFGSSGRWEDRTMHVECRVCVT